MNLQEKDAVRQMRIKGLSYSAIAHNLCVSENTIKSFCQRNRLGGMGGAVITTLKEAPETQCKQCGKRLHHKPKCKPRKFCSDTCRHVWWKEHREQLNKKAYYYQSCAHCGKEFKSYGDDSRKYCCHDCYIKARFGEYPKIRAHLYDTAQAS